MKIGTDLPWGSYFKISQENKISNSIVTPNNGWSKTAATGIAKNLDGIRPIKNTTNPSRGIALGRG